MGNKFDINLEQAMELLNLETDFTEKEFKTNYRKLIMSIHPDTLGDINPIALKILEEEAKRTNIAKGVIESFLNGEYSEHNVNKSSSNYKRESSSNTNQDKQRKERDYQEQQRNESEQREKQRAETKFHEEQRKERERQDNIKRNREMQERQRKTKEFQEGQQQKRKKVHDIILVIVIIIVVIIAIDVSTPNTINPQIVTESNQVASNNNIEVTPTQIENTVTEKPIQTETISVAKPLQSKKTPLITIGSTSQDVKSIMGTPTTIYDALNEWVYESSSISFDSNRKVIGWSNYSGNLKVSLGDSQANAPYITIGSTREDVIKSMGTPTTIYDILKEWGYDSSSISFDSNWKVLGWSNYSDNLKVSLGDAQANAPYITIGSTREDVIKSMGTPTTIYDILREWGYDSSSISFDSNWKVLEWSNYSDNLKVK